MYKRKGCTVWTIEEKDFGSIYEIRGGLGNQLLGFIIKDLKWVNASNLKDEIDIILEVGGKRYLGYFNLEKTELQYIKGLKQYIVNGKERFYGSVYASRIDFVVCQENYLDGIEIIKEVKL